MIDLDRSKPLNLVDRELSLDCEFGQHQHCHGEVRKRECAPCPCACHAIRVKA